MNRKQPYHFRICPLPFEIRRVKCKWYQKYPEAFYQGWPCKGQCVLIEAKASTAQKNTSLLSLSPQKKGKGEISKGAHTLQTNCDKGTYLHEGGSERRV